MPTPTQRRVRVAALIAVVVVPLLVFARHRYHARTGAWFGGSWLRDGWFESSDTAGPDAEEEIPDAATLAWCAPGLTPVPGGGCFAAPEGPAADNAQWPLVLYLHGIFDPAADAEELSRQSRVAAKALAGGFAVLALRGHVGQCSAPEYASRVCWPSNERNEDAGPSFVAEWSVPLAHARRLGGRGRRYVLGFSNGGYFSGLLAERAWFDAGGFVVARGGPVMPVRPSGPKFPVLLALSDGDPSHEEMLRLDEELVRQAWPHEKVLSHGGHELPDGDIAAAIEFFREQERAAL
jgi:predicted esterase